MLDSSECWFNMCWFFLFRLVLVYVRSSSKSLCPRYHCPTSASQLSWQWRLACLDEKLWLCCIGERPFYWYLEKWWVMSVNFPLGLVPPKKPPRSLQNTIFRNCSLFECGDWPSRLLVWSSKKWFAQDSCSGFLCPSLGSRAWRRQHDARGLDFSSLIRVGKI